MADDNTTIADDPTIPESALFPPIADADTNTTVPPKQDTAAEQAQENTTAAEVPVSQANRGEVIAIDEYGNAGTPMSLAQAAALSGSTPDVGAFSDNTPSEYWGSIQRSAQTVAMNDSISRGDWRVRLSLAPSANYLYKGPNPGILSPLIGTNGVVFPYTPDLTIAYNADYDMQQITHSNYTIPFYKGSRVENLTISGDFTAQTTQEAAYLLAVMHFFKSATKMFYGQDQNPAGGTPPPLCFLNGYGTYQFSNHPLVVSSYTQSLPTDVDYISVSANDFSGGNQYTPRNGVNAYPSSFVGGTQSFSGAMNLISTVGRLFGANLAPGGGRAQSFMAPPMRSGEITYVPTKMKITITCIPIVTRTDISNRFSLRDYASGQLLKGKQNGKAGIW